MSDNYSVHVGTPPAGDQQTWESRAIHFHRFQDLPSGRDESVSSPDFTCLGHGWSIKLYPRRLPRSSGDLVTVSLQTKELTDSICIEFYFAVRDSTGMEVARSGTFPFRDIQGTIFKRSTMIDALLGGTLTIEVWMRKSDTASAIIDSTPFVPENPIRENILEMFMEEELADVIFQVGGGGPGGRSCKKAKTAATIFYAHRLIVQKMAFTFADLCRQNEGETITIPITDVRAGVFRIMLYYGYGGEIPDEELRANANELIDAADKYGMTSLKLAAEACYVKTTLLGLDNIIENLLYAHYKNCALLKETAMDFVLRNRGSIMDEVSLEELPSSMMKDLLAAVARGEPEDEEIDGIDYHSIRVGTLRRRLNEKGLDVNGSREAMIALFKEYCVEPLH